MKAARRLPKSWSLLSDTKIKLKAGVISKPMWFDTMAAMPDIAPVVPTRKTTPKMKQIVFPEDKLRDKFLQRNPEGHLYPLRFLPFENTAEYMITSPADIFASKQIELIQSKGYTENQAYVATEKWLKEKQFASDLETELLGAQLALFEPYIERTDLTPFGRIHREFYEPEADHDVDEYPRFTNEDTVGALFEEVESILTEEVERSAPSREEFAEADMSEDDPEFELLAKEHPEWFDAEKGQTHPLQLEADREVDEMIQMEQGDNEPEGFDVTYEEFLGKDELNAIKWRALNADIPDLEYFTKKK